MRQRPADGLAQPVAQFDRHVRVETEVLERQVRLDGRPRRAEHDRRVGTHESERVEVLDDDRLRLSDFLHGIEPEPAALERIRRQRDPTPAREHRGPIDGDTVDVQLRERGHEPAE